MGRTEENLPPRSKFTPPELAARWGIDTAKVYAWIRSGELVAINAATRRSGRPRYLVDLTDLADFELRRAVEPNDAPLTNEGRL